VDRGGLGKSRDDTDSELDSPTVLAGQRYTDTVTDELTSSDCDRLDSDEGTSETGGREFTDV
jgi:hypothetical protein